MTITRIQSPLLHCLLLLGATFFSSYAYAETLYVVNSQSRTLSRIDTISDEVNNHFATLGNVPNKIVVDEDFIWSVNSGDNALQKIDRHSGATLANIFIGPGVNPWDAIRHQDRIYVTGLFTGKVYRVDVNSGSVSGSVNVGVAPEALHVIGDKLYVSNAGNYAQNYAGSSVSVIDLNSFTLERSIPVHANPQYLASLEGKLHVSCTGNWTDIAGAVCIIDPESDSVVHTIELGGTPGRIWIANPDLALVADSNGVQLFSYNPQSYEILHGASNPLPNGGSDVAGNENLIAVLVPNWSANGGVNLLYNDLSIWKQYTVAMMPTDLKLAPNPSSTDDPAVMIPPLTVFPNPVHRGAALAFKLNQPISGELLLYNLRGQLIARHTIDGKDISLRDLSLSSGVYFYTLNPAHPQDPIYRGKFLVIN